ncbi:MAG: exonuclease domain-containing protein [bacterium]|nr:exonuclease domain-containing protein [bacterium]
MLPQRLAFVDLETTGGSLNRDRIIEIGILRVEDGKLVKTYQSLIDPGTRVPPEIERLTGITSKELEGAPTFYQIKDDIKEALKDCVFVAHNVRFDYSFLKNEFKRYNVKFSPKHFCTVKLSRHLYPKERRHNLDAVMERFNIPCEKRHRAFDDASVLWEFYQKVQGLFSVETIMAGISSAIKKPTLPINITQLDLERIPESPGVYIFYGAEGMPLYIGKSVNLKNRVLQHFSSDHLSGIEMKIAQQIQNIETIETVGELGALIKESDLIKKLQPLYNRRLRNLKQLVVKPWPFEKAIVIQEEESGRKESFLIDKWCYVGSIKTEDEAENLEISTEVRFDLDIYKIIEKFLRTKPNLRVAQYPAI